MVKDAGLGALNSAEDDSRDSGGEPPPFDRSFVVQFRCDADPAHGQVTGRIEHLPSGQARRFESVQEMMAFICDQLAAHDSAALRRVDGEELL